MAKFLVTVWSYPGHVHPMMAIAQALRTRGHAVAFYTGARAQRAIEGEGFQCFPFRMVDEERIYEIVQREFYHFPSFWGALRHRRKIRAWLRESYLDTIPGQVED